MNRSCETAGKTGNFPGVSREPLQYTGSETPAPGSDRLRAALEKAVARLLAERTAAGHWEGELSSSALATATAVIALSTLRKAEGGPEEPQDEQVTRGLDWLAQNLNHDGGWGDTTRSLSNLSTTALCWAAFGAVPSADEKYQAVVARAIAWLARYVNAGSILSIPALTRAIIARYGEDRTFSVPILTACALAGRLGAGRQAWHSVLPLPFELAACPRQWFAALRLPVVSYALPALIAIGQARHFHAPSGNPVAHLARALSRKRTLRILTEIQPANGGFLEATPLTSFVVMSLAGSGQATHPVTRKGMEFLRRGQRRDGSWPIDTNLATWLTTLAVNALSNLAAQADSSWTANVRSWLLQQQYRTLHLYTQAAPGGWAWTDLPGGVPDADDTAGAILALAKLRKAGQLDQEIVSAARAGIRWLLDLQNRDGGIPTFCRGWGALPFDRSSADITAHALQAWLVWSDELTENERRELDAAIRHGAAFLAKAQKTEGAWAPLWFGNEFAPGEENLTYGTARVICALTLLLRRTDMAVPAIVRAYEKGVGWLLTAQNGDGGWGGAPGVISSIEETALAVEALAGCDGSRDLSDAVARGAAFLVGRIERSERLSPAPIGFYFAKLWYWEKLYPQIFTVGALGRVANRQEGDDVGSL